MRRMFERYAKTRLSFSKRAIGLFLDLKRQWKFLRTARICERTKYSAVKRSKHAIFCFLPYYLPMLAGACDPPEKLNLACTFCVRL